MNEKDYVCTVIEQLAKSLYNETREESAKIEHEYGYPADLLATKVRNHFNRPTFKAEKGIIGWSIKYTPQRLGAFVEAVQFATGEKLPVYLDCWALGPTEQGSCYMSTKCVNAVHVEQCQGQLALV